MEQLTKNQAVATSQEAVQNQNEPQLRDENAHNDKSRSEERFSRNAETDLVCRLLLEKKNVFLKFSAFHNEPGHLNGDGLNILCNDVTNKLISCFYNDTSTTEIYTLSLHDALPIYNSLKTKLSLLPKKLFRIRMSRNFGMKMLTMTNLSTECLIQLTKLGYDATPFNQILKQNAKREMRLRLGKVTVAD